MTATPGHARVNAGLLLTAQGAVYRVAVLSLRPAVAATVDVSAATGRVVAVRDDNRYADAVGTVFDPNPIVTARDSTLRQPGVDEAGADTDLDSAALTAQLKDVPIRGYDAAQAPAGRLVGPWAQVQGAQPYVALDGRIEQTRGMPGFEGLMAYAHIDRYQRYLQETLGFTGGAAINAEPQDTYALPVQGFDNSFYQPANDLMVFGAGGVDDGEDAEVILHKYGHAVQDAQVPGWGGAPEGGAMGEGFGDFQAGAYYAHTSNGFQDVCLMDWDSTSYSSASPACIRRMDSTKTWPEDRTGSVHSDGDLVDLPVAPALAPRSHRGRAIRQQPPARPELARAARAERDVRQGGRGAADGGHGAWPPGVGGARRRGGASLRVHQLAGLAFAQATILSDPPTPVPSSSSSTGTMSLPVSSLARWRPLDLLKADGRIPSP